MKVKLSEKQKEVIVAIRNGAIIRKSDRGTGTTKARSVLRYSNGRGIAGPVSLITMRVLRKKKLLSITSDDLFRTKYSLTKLGKTIEL